MPLHGAVGAEDQQRRLAHSARVDLVDELPAVHHRHHQIEKDDGRPLARQHVERFPAVGGHQDSVALGRETKCERLQNVWIVVDDEHQTLAWAFLRHL